MTYRTLRGSGMWIVALGYLVIAPAPAPAGGKGRLPAFPGAEGYGAVSIGGRGGRVVHVTSLKDSGPGSIAAALAAPGPRIIVFDVGGTVELMRNLEIPAGNGRVTIAGQTAPGGITFLGGTLWLRRWGRRGGPNEDIIIRHVRLRGVHNTARPGQGGDNLCAAGTRRLIVDHCSFTGSADESIDCCNVTQVTFQWCTIEESALKGQGGAQHTEGSHNLAMIFGYQRDALASIHHNLFAHHRYRMPVFATGRVCDFRNNVIYNWATHASSFHGSIGSNLVGNTWVRGPNTRTANIFYNAQGKGIYFRDNALLPGRSPPADQRALIAGCTGHDRMKLFDRAVSAPPVRTMPCREGYEAVLKTAGAWPRDATTRRTVREVRARAGRFGLSGPYERLAARTDGPTSARYDTDRDGMPDKWERSHGLDPADPADGNRIVPKGASAGDRHAGYTYVEYYINELADGIAGAAGESATVRVKVAGPGRVVCGHGGRTRKWQLRRSPLEVDWGGANTFNKGSTVVLKAVGKTSLRTRAPTVSDFVGWSGGTVDGRKEPVLYLVADRDMTITAHFRPRGETGPAEPRRGK